MSNPKEKIPVKNYSDQGVFKSNGIKNHYKPQGNIWKGTTPCPIIIKRMKIQIGDKFKKS